MKLKKFTIGYLLILSIILILISHPYAKSLGGLTTDKKSLLSDYVQHAPIVINSNNDFANIASSEGWPGDGSSTNPYIIQNIEINASGYGAAIYIGNTTVYFIIQNVDVHHAQFKGNFRLGAGIMLINVTHGNIINSKIHNNANHGIYMDRCSDVKLEMNEIKDNKWGIFVGVLGNSKIDNNTITSNTVSGIVIGSRSNNVVVEYNTLFKDNYGIEIRDSSNTRLKNNTIDGDGSGAVGIRLYNSTGIICKNNTVENNWYGIFVEHGSSNQISGNIIIRNSEYGVYITGSSSNTIYENEFFYNHGSGDKYDSSHIQALDNGTDNTWYSTTTHRGNYWHDWANNNDTNDPDNDGIVNYSYRIDGSAGAEDPYPLKKSNYTVPELEVAIIVISLIFVVFINIKK